MTTLNKVEIIGRLGNDPEIRVMPNGESVANLSIATREHWTDRISGEKKERTEWHRIVFYARLADVARQYLKKGGLVYVEGKLRTKEYTDKEGIKRYITEIQGTNLLMLSNTPSTPTQQDTEYSPYQSTVSDSSNVEL